jgi:hypothetical protein
LDCAFSVCFVSLHFSHTFLAPPLTHPHPPPAQLVLDRHVLASLRHLDVRALLSNLPVNKAIAMLDAVQAHLARALNAHATAADAAAEAMAQAQAAEALDPASSSSSAPSSASSTAASASASSTAAAAALSEADALIAALRSHRAVILAALPDSIRASVIASRPPPTPTASTPASSATSASSAASAISASSVSLASAAAAAASAAPAQSSAVAAALPSTPTMTSTTPTTTTTNAAISLTPVQPQPQLVSSGGALSGASDDRGAVLSPPVASAPPASSESGDRPAFDLHVCENFF